MENQNERKEWNERWEQQIALWEAQINELLDQAEMLLALIELAESQIKHDPPE